MMGETDRGIEDTVMRVPDGSGTGKAGSGLLGSQDPAPLSQRRRRAHLRTGSPGDMGRILESGRLQS